MSGGTAGGRVLLLYLRTGGGHLAPARAVAQAMEAEPGDAPEAVLVDALDGGSAFARFVLEDGYRRLQSHAIWLYETLYATNKLRPLARFNCAFAALWLTPAVRRHLERVRPGRILVAHFLLIRPVREALEQLGWSIPVLTLVTDPYTAHPMWFLDPEQHLVVCSDRLRAHAVARGFPAGRVAVAPFPVEARYDRPMDVEGKADVRRRFSLPPGGSVVLLLGGGDGLPRGAALLEALLASGADAAVLMVCGRNERLRRSAESVAARHPGARAAVFGFVDYVYDLLNVADVVIAKPGASTTMQMMMLGGRCVITDYMWEQEKGNVEAITRSGFGVFEPRVARVPDAVRRMLALGPAPPSAELRGGAQAIARMLAG